MINLICILSGLESALKGDKVDAFINVAGGWAGGNAAHKGMFFSIFKLMYWYHASFSNNDIKKTQFKGLKVIIRWQMQGKASQF